MATILGVTSLSPPAAIVIDVGSADPEMSNIDFIVAEALIASSHSPYTTTAIQLRKREHSSTIVRSSRKPHLTTVTATAIEVVNEEVVLDVKNTANSSHLSPEAVGAPEALIKNAASKLRLH